MAKGWDGAGLLKVMLVIAACLGPAPVMAQGSGTLRIATPALPQSLVNPYRTIAPPSIYVTAAIFDTLTRFDHEGALQPWLATDWRRDGANAWVFNLRKNVKFSNGEPFDAAAVVAAVSFVTSPEGRVEGVYREMPFLGGVEAISEHSVRVSTTTPVPLLPRVMAALPIPAPQQWKRLGVAGFAREPVGTGPFKVIARRANALSLAAYEGSWRKPKVAGLEFTVVPVPNSRVTGLMSGVFDIAYDLGPDDLKTLNDSGNVAVVTITNSVTGISFFLKNPSPFSDVRVRQAANMAVNRQAIIDGLLAGTTKVPSQPATPTTLGYNPELQPYPYDPARAKALLAEAGYAKGFTFSMETSVGYAPNDSAIFQQIAQDLRAVGIRMEIVTLPVTEFLTRRGNGSLRAEAFAAEWPAWPTLDGLRAVRTHSCLREPVWYCNPSVTPLIEAALAEENTEQAVALRRQIMQRFRDDAPAIFLFGAPQFTGLRAGITGYREDANLVSYHDISLP
ncbi:MAG: ABC transporter substrate-binding protein [Rhodospirillaceae bacterium]|nr:ABC transporter substrate-binding protein [Rhodospirillaceae bacterium]